MAKPGSAVPERIRGSTRFYPYFQDCIGAIDGTHIPATVSGRDNNSYQFIYVLSGWEGSAHDSHVLTDALSRNNGLKMPRDQGRHHEDAKELFNLRHASLKNVIERTFDNEAQLSSSAQVYEDDDFDQLFDTQEQQRAKANEWRDTLANGMWSDVDQIVNND
ncbi:uncharacterized protein [Primulina eburnea]|uniref:uncharacterized protein n=1 Tax=Primulina eburnea TaxID=1245227 RepID=UPI003C6BFC4A